MSYQNLGQFLKENSKKHQQRIAYEIRRGFRTQRFTFEEVYDLSLKTASFLTHQGLKKGDKVAIWAGNCPEYPILYFGCWLVGCVAVPIDIRTTEETLKIFLTKAKCSLGFKGKFIPGDFGKLVKETFYLEDLVELVNSQTSPPRSNFVTPRRWPQDSSEVNLDDLAEIAFTSGTTGTPKGVMLTHANFLSDVEALTQAFPFQKNWRALSLLPLSHAFEQVVDLLALFQTGIKVTYLERANRLTILKALRKGKITSVVLVPQALQLLMNGIEMEVEKQGKQKVWRILNILAPNLPKWTRRLLFHSVHQKLGGNLQFFGSGSAPLNLKLAQKWEALGIEIFEGYGATETTAALTINTLSAKKLGSVGKVLPGMEIAINPEVSIHHTPGVEGEIWAKGANISPGYFQDEQKTNQVFTSEESLRNTSEVAEGLLRGEERWYRTGDVGEIDKDGFLYITGRESFRIVLANGQKVYPEDLEKKLNSHSLIKESCVVGIKREPGEVVHAAVITDYPNKLDSIIKDVNTKLSSHEQIMEWSHWSEQDFPRTPILKIDRRKVTATIQGIQGIKTEKQPSLVKTQDKLISLISQVTKTNPGKIKETAILATDLKMDSLGRVELLSLIEEELAASISETQIDQHTKVSDLRKLIEQVPTAEDELPVVEQNYSPWAFNLRILLQNWLVFPLHNLFVPIEVQGQKNLKNLSMPAIFYFNHIGVMDGVCVLRVLPQEIRQKLVIVANAKLWGEWRRFFVEGLGGGLPFDNQEKVKASLELVGEFLDKGFSLLLTPEGEFTKNGKLLRFKPGIGLLATQMQVLVIPVKIDRSYREIFPPVGGFLENIPQKRKKIIIKIGQPLSFKKDLSYAEASSQMQRAMEQL